MAKFLWVLLLILFPGAPSASAAPTVWKVSASPGLESYYPLLRSLYHDLGYTVEFEVMPNERALQQVDSGKLNAQIGRIEGGIAGYSNLIQTKEPISLIRLQAWVLRGPKQAWTAADLNGLKIGGLIGNKLTETYTRERGLALLWVPTQEALASMLQTQRLDVVLLISSFTHSPVAEVGELVLPDLTASPVFHVLNKAHAALAEPFDQMLRQYKRDGRYRQLVLTDRAP